MMPQNTVDNARIASSVSIWSATLAGMSVAKAVRTLLDAKYLYLLYPHFVWFTYYLSVTSTRWDKAGHHQKLFLINRYEEIIISITTNQVDWDISDYQILEVDQLVFSYFYPTTSFTWLFFSSGERHMPQMAGIPIASSTIIMQGTGIELLVDKQTIWQMTKDKQCSCLTRAKVQGLPQYRLEQITWRSPVIQYMVNPHRKQLNIADHICINQEARMLNRQHKLQMTMMPIEESRIRNRSDSLPPKNPPSVHPHPNISRQNPAFRLFCFLSSTLGARCSIVLVLTPRLIPSIRIKHKVNFMMGQNRRVYLAAFMTFPQLDSFFYTYSCFTYLCYPQSYLISLMKNDPKKNARRATPDTIIKYTVWLKKESPNVTTIAPKIVLIQKSILNKPQQYPFLSTLLQAWHTLWMQAPALVHNTLAPMPLIVAPKAAEMNLTGADVPYMRSPVEYCNTQVKAAPVMSHFSEYLTWGANRLAIMKTVQLRAKRKGPRVQSPSSSLILVTMV